MATILTLILDPSRCFTWTSKLSREGYAYYLATMEETNGKSLLPRKGSVHEVTRNPAQIGEFVLVKPSRLHEDGVRRGREEKHFISVFLFKY